MIHEQKGRMTNKTLGIAQNLGIAQKSFKIPIVSLMQTIIQF